MKGTRSLNSRKPKSRAALRSVLRDNSFSLVSLIIQAAIFFWMVSDALDHRQPEPAVLAIECRLMSTVEF